jgi:hypothetical protein
MNHRMPEWNGYDDVGSARTDSVFHLILKATIRARAFAGDAIRIWHLCAPAFFVRLTRATTDIDTR